MARERRFLLLFIPSALAIVSNNSNELLDVRIQLPGEFSAVGVSNKDRCLEQVHSSLEKLRKRQSSRRVPSLIDLSGYALHQSLRNAPVDMYVTDIKVRTPSVGSWVQVQGCQFSRQAEMRTQLIFNDLLVSGTVRLLPGETFLSNPEAQSSEFCTMTLRLRRAGLDVKASPDYKGGPKVISQGRGLQLRTESNFVEPNFLSVHAYGCRLDQWAKEGWFAPSRDETPIFRSLDEKIQPELRIMSLGGEPELGDTQDNDVYLQRILPYTPSANEKLAAIISVKKKIDQQTNAVFQAHGPFSSQPQKPLFTPHHELKPVSGQTQPESAIIELDEKLRPIGTVAQKPFESLINSAQALPPKLPLYGQPPLLDVSSEMEDVFLRGTKALLSKYLEKQLEIPLKEALMTKIGYTVSYG